MRTRLLVLATIAGMAGLLSACSGTTAGTTVVTTAPSSTASAAVTSSTATSSTPAPAPKVVTVTKAASHKRTVVRVVPAAPPAPMSGNSLRALFDDSSSVDSYDYETDGAVFFDAPSQNIGCYLNNDATLDCAIHDYDFPQPGPDCDAGIGARLDGSGEPSLTDCDGYFPVAHQGEVLGYGQSVSNGSLGCVSEANGISCVNLDMDTGFTISKQAFTPVY